MTPYKVREHNQNCSDDEIIWCECSKREPILLSCKNCGGAVEAVIMNENRPNESLLGPAGTLTPSALFKEMQNNHEQLVKALRDE